MVLEVPVAAERNRAGRIGAGCDVGSGEVGEGTDERLPLGAPGQVAAVEEEVPITGERIAPAGDGAGVGVGAAGVEPAAAELDGRIRAVGDDVDGIQLLVAGQDLADLGDAVREGCDAVLAWRATSSLLAEQVLEIVAGVGRRCPVFVYADSYTEQEIVELMRAGAADCLRKGDLARLKDSLERELAKKAADRAVPSPNGSEATDRYRALIEEIPALISTRLAEAS